MDIKVNGEAMQLIAKEQGLMEVLTLLGLPQDQPGIAIAVNMELVPRSMWAQTSVQEGDEIEVITARQGG
jgi:sulfur carrier protein